MLAQHIFALALSLPAPWYAPGTAPESGWDYYARVATMSAAIAAEAPDEQTARAVLVVWHGESGFRLDVHAGDYLGDGGRAACNGQLHASGWVPPAEWQTLAGVSLEASQRCAAATVRVLSRFRRWCGSWAGAFSAYATGQGCAVIPLGEARARQQRELTLQKML